MYKIPFQSTFAPSFAPKTPLIEEFSSASNINVEYKITKTGIIICQGSAKNGIVAFVDPYIAASTGTSKVIKLDSLYVFAIFPMIIGLHIVSQMRVDAKTAPALLGPSIYIIN